jgi:hypothetical protein
MPKKRKRVKSKMNTPKLRNVEKSRSQATIGKRPPGLQVCKKCQAVYLRKRWQWNYPMFTENKNDKSVATICPACAVTRPEQAEGTLELYDYDSATQRQEILKMLRNAEARARERDPLDRIFLWEKSGKTDIIYTTENQLAMSLGRQVRRAFGGDLEFKTSAEEDIVRLRWRGVIPNKK